MKVEGSLFTTFFPQLQYSRILRQILSYLDTSHTCTMKQSIIIKTLLVMAVLSSTLNSLQNGHMNMQGSSPYTIDTDQRKMDLYETINQREDHNIITSGGGLVYSSAVKTSTNDAVSTNGQKENEAAHAQFSTNAPAEKETNFDVIKAASTEQLSAADKSTIVIEKKKGPAIAMLISNSEKDVRNLKEALKSLDKFMPHDNMTTPVLFFNEGNLDEEQKNSILNTTERPIHFPLVDFQQFPDGFNPETEEGNWKKRSKWGYQQMCRFWATKIWEHPILDDYSTFMRFDTDSCFTQSLDKDLYLPGLPVDKPYAYAANRICKDNPEFTAGLFELTNDYAVANNITVKNPDLWDDAKKGKIVLNNFEISNITFFRQPAVMAFQSAISEAEPFGVFRKRWGDAPIRLITLAVFAEESEVMWNSQPKGYKHPCPGSVRVS